MFDQQPCTDPLAEVIGEPVPFSNSVPCTEATDRAREALIEAA